MRKIDLSAWPRREIYEAHAGMTSPFFMISFRVDVTRVYDWARPRGLSFYYAMVWLTAAAMNSVENFRYTWRGDEVWLADARDPSFTDLHPGSELYHIVTLPAGDSPEEFCRRAKEASQSQTRFLDLSKESGDLIFVSCLPWLDLTAVRCERNLDPRDCTPRLTWGKYTEDGTGRKVLCLCVEANHAFVDGLHVGRFAQKLDELIAAL